MLTFVIILILCLAFYTGYRRGFVRELVYTLGYTISFIFAWQTYQTVGNALTMWVPYPVAELDQQMALYTTTDLSRVYYDGLGFLVAFLIGWLLVRLVGGLLYKLTDKFNAHLLNRLVGGIVNFCLSYVFLVCLLTVVSVIPIDALQKTLSNQPLINQMITKTPVLSEKLQNEWFAN